MQQHDQDMSERRPPPEVFGFDRRKAVVTGLVAAVLAIGAVALLGEVAHYDRLLAALRSANKHWFPLCILGEVIAYTGYILAYRDLARADGGPVLGYWKVTRIVGLGFGAYIVGASAGGLAVDYWALHRAGAGPHEAGRRVLALNTLEWLILGLFACGASIAVLAGAGHDAPLGMTLGWLTVVPLCIAGGAYASSPKRIDRLSQLPSTPLPAREGRDPRSWARWFAAAAKRGLRDAIGSLHYLRFVLARPRRYPAGVGGFAVYWLGDLLTMYAALRAFGVHIGGSDLILAYATGYVVTSAPLPAGASGASEATTAFALHAVGVPLAPALLAVFTYRFFTFWLPILPALGFLSTVRTLADELPGAPREPAAEPA
ncbi:MAG TPA: lysylphosphatidylglycerol synthase transmembrane domain-containing protein [Gaiellaceae bacterium]